MREVARLSNGANNKYALPIELLIGRRRRASTTDQPIRLFQDVSARGLLPRKKADHNEESAER
jgi:hypothetical protein